MMFRDVETQLGEKVGGQIRQPVKLADLLILFISRQIFPLIVESVVPTTALLAMTICRSILSWTRLRMSSMAQKKVEAMVSGSPHAGLRILKNRTWAELTSHGMAWSVLLQYNYCLIVYRQPIQCDLKPF